MRNYRVRGKYMTNINQKKTITHLVVATEFYRKRQDSNRMIKVVLELQ